MDHVHVSVSSLRHGWGLAATLVGFLVVVAVLDALLPPRPFLVAAVVFLGFSLILAATVRVIRYRHGRSL
jgi:hypothetical protein